MKTFPRFRRKLALLLSVPRKYTIFWKGTWSKKYGECEQEEPTRTLAYLETYTSSLWLPDKGQISLLDIQGSL